MRTMCSSVAGSSDTAWGCVGMILGQPAGNASTVQQYSSAKVVHTCLMKWPYSMPFIRCTHVTVHCATEIPKFSCLNLTTNKIGSLEVTVS